MYVYIQHTNTNAKRDVLVTGRSVPVWHNMRRICFIHHANSTVNVTARIRAFTWHTLLGVSPSATVLETSLIAPVHTVSLLKLQALFAGEVTGVVMVMVVVDVAVRLSPHQQPLLLPHAAVERLGQGRVFLVAVVGAREADVADCRRCSCRFGGHGGRVLHLLGLGRPQGGVDSVWRLGVRGMATRGATRCVMGAGPDARAVLVQDTLSRLLVWQHLGDEGRRCVFG